MVKHLLTTGFLLIISLFAGCALPDKPEPPKDYNVLMIVLDACRPDHLGCYGYIRATSPNIDRFASESILFEQAYSQGIQTLPSFGSFLTGRYPMALNLYWTNPPHRILHPEELTLAEVLRIHNYQTAAFPTGPHLLPLFGLDQGFQIYTNNPDFDLTKGTETDFLHQRVMSRATAFSKPDGKREVWSFQDTLPLITSYLKLPHNKPFFLLAHSNDTHPPYDNPIEFAHKFDPDYKGIFCREFRLTLNTLNNINGNKLSLKGLSPGWDYIRATPVPNPASTNVFEEIMLSDQDLNHIQAHYDGAIAYADDGVGRILTQLADSGLDKNTIVILISDHGETIGERELFDRSFGKPLPIYNEVSHAPMIVRYPGIRNAQRISQPVQLIDLMPTILDLIGIKAPDNLDGISLKSVIATTDAHRLTQINKDRPIITEALPNELAFRVGEWKLIYRLAGQSELYHLKNDPDEKTNLIARPETQSIYQELMAKVLSWQTGQLSKRGAWAKEFDENLMERIYPKK